MNNLMIDREQKQRERESYVKNVSNFKCNTVAKQVISWMIEHSWQVKKKKDKIVEEWGKRGGKTGRIKR